MKNVVKCLKHFFGYFNALKILKVKVKNIDIYLMPGRFATWEFQV